MFKIKLVFVWRGEVNELGLHDVYSVPAVGHGVVVSGTLYKVTQVVHVLDSQEIIVYVDI